LTARYTKPHLLARIAAGAVLAALPLLVAGLGV
jgi:hypothetical protein